MTHLSQNATLPHLKEISKKVKTCIKKGISVDSSFEGRSLLARSATCGHFSISSYLLKKNANVQDRTVPGFTSAGLASSLEIFRAFKEKGASVDLFSLRKRKEAHFALFGKVLLPKEAKGLNLWDIKELVLNFWEDEKKRLFEIESIPSLHSDIGNAIALMSKVNGHTQDTFKLYLTKISDGIKEGIKPFFIKTG